MLEALIIPTVIAPLLLSIIPFLDDGVRFVDVDIKAERDRALRHGDIYRALKAQERLNR